MAILDRIKFDGLSSRDWIIYKYYNEKIPFGSTLVVGEGQVALFVKSGHVCDIFMPGSYTMDTKNLPILSGLINLPFGGKTPFTAEIYFINTVTKLDIAWGTPDPIQLIDPMFKIRLRIRAFGQLGLKIKDYSSFFTELVGSMAGSDLVKYDKVLDFFKGILVSKTKSFLAEIIINDKISALEITAHIDDISTRIHEKLIPEFERFGFNIVNFYIKSINFPNEDFEKINKILEDKAAFDIMGDARYAAKRSFDVYEGAANNEGGIAGAFVAGGIGLGAGSQLASNVNTTVSVPKSDAVYCPKCNHANLAGAKFCISCGSTMAVRTTAKCSCGADIIPGAKFCNECGKSLLPTVCECGATLSNGAKFCIECGKKV